MAKLVEITGMDQTQATRVLWETYSPHLHVWLPFAAIGIIAAAALFIFGRAARKWADMDA
jgi:hypothetical protein